jgi:hypothetical protein
MEQQIYFKGLVAANTPVDIAKRLKKLRRSFEEAGGQPDDQIVFALILADICEALGLSGIQRYGVLGWKGASYLANWGDQTVGLTPQEEQGERATGNSAPAA